MFLSGKSKTIWVFLLSIMLTWNISIHAQQTLETIPLLPVHNMPVTVIFHSDLGNQGLMNYAGDDVYAHTGVITDKSRDLTDWRYVKADWDQNIPACKLVKISANEYQFNITTSIRAFYQVPDNEKILKMAFVFRNSTGSVSGREIADADIYNDVFEEGIQVNFIQPSGRFSFISENTDLQVAVSSNASDSVFLFLDHQLIKKTNQASFDTVFLPESGHLHMLVAAAKKVDQICYDTTWYMIPAATQDELIPDGIRDGINYVGEDSIVFSIFAPGKASVFLIGDFNNWLPDSIYQFRKNNNHFWLSLGGLTPGKEYVFQYIIDQNLTIADPYSEKILDPNFDPEIPATVYPHLITYPTFLANGIAGVVQPGKPEYVWEDDEFEAPAARDLIIYEMLIRDFVATHDIKDVKLKLDYLQTLGINAVELMPFSEFEANSSWGYNPSFYFAVDKYYGRDTDIKDFIQECHKRGIAVIMDVVLNHSYGQNPMVRMYYNAVTKKPTPQNPWFNVQSPNTTYSWGFDFNHESQATAYFVDRVTEYWLTQYHIDGFRFDFTKGFTNTPGDGSTYDASRIVILKRIYDSIRTVSPIAYMICEHFAPNNEEKELSDYGMLLWGNSNYNFNEATMGYLNKSDFSWASYKSRGWSKPNLVSYMESHDEERLMFKNITYGNSSGDYNIKDPGVALDRMELAGIFFLSIPGPKMIWQFGELGYDISIDYNDRVGEKPVKWDYFDNADRKQLYLTWAKMIDIRKNYPVFRTSNYSMSVGNGVAFKKITLIHDEGDALIVGNFGMTSGSVQPGFTHAGWWYEIFSGDSINVSDLDQSVALDAGAYKVYTQKKMTSVISSTDQKNQSRIGLFPNPAKDLLYVNLDRKIDTFEIFSLSGIPVKTGKSLIPFEPIDISELKSGMYIIKIKHDQQVTAGKFIKR